MVVVILPWKKVNVKLYKTISCILGHVSANFFKQDIDVKISSKILLLC